MSIWWFAFILSSLAVVVSGFYLTKNVDLLAEAKGLSKGFLGFILLASITSLPEMITTAYSSAGLGVNDQAIGNVFGSNLFNVLIFTIIGLLFTLERIHGSGETFVLSKGNIIAGIFSIMLTAFFLEWIPFETSLGQSLSIFNIDLISYFFLIAYLVAAYIIWTGSKEYEKGSDSRKSVVGSFSEAKVYLIIAVLSIIIIVASIFLSKSVKVIALTNHLNFSFAGAVLLAVVTSLPELVVSISSIHFLSPEMAHGNILGSNLFNLVNLSIADIFFRKGVIYWQMEKGGFYLASGSIVLTSIMILSILSPPRKTFLGRLSLGTLLILILYFVTIYASWHG